MVRGVYSSIAKREPERALALLESDINAAGKKEIAWNLARQQASYDPTGAIAWAASQKDESLQMAATESAVGAWASQDAYAASEWLTAQPAGPVREAAVSALVGYLMQTTPDDALPWALSIADPQKRQEAQINIIGNVMHRDFQKATQMSANLQLSDENQKRISEMRQSFQNCGN